MKFWKIKPLIASVFIAQAAIICVAQTHSADDIKKDIQRHRAMAAAHEGAAKCLESGKKDNVCEKELQTACKGLGIGKNCGMKHEH